MKQAYKQSYLRFHFYVDYNNKMYQQCVDRTKANKVINFRFSRSISVCWLYIISYVHC